MSNDEASPAVRLNGSALPAHEDGQNSVKTLVAEGFFSYNFKADLCYFW
jgi:hypothetical protein